jgi:hypothetical protein
MSNAQPDYTNAICERAEHVIADARHYLVLRDPLSLDDARRRLQALNDAILAVTRKGGASFLRQQHFWGLRDWVARAAATSDWTPDSGTIATLQALVESFRGRPAPVPIDLIGEKTCTEDQINAALATGYGVMGRRALMLKGLTPGQIDAFRNPDEATAERSARAATSPTGAPSATEHEQGPTAPPRHSSDLAPRDPAAELSRQRKPTRAALVAYMKDRDVATYEEIATHVHGNDEMSGDTIRKNVHRTNEDLAVMQSPIRYRCASSSVYKETSPE